MSLLFFRDACFCSDTQRGEWVASSSSLHTEGLQIFSCFHHDVSACYFLCQKPQNTGQFLRCARVMVFQHSRSYFGLQQEITCKHLRTRAFRQKNTRTWHHSWSLVHAGESRLRLPEEQCFSQEKNEPICRVGDFLVELK